MTAEESTNVVEKCSVVLLDVAGTTTSNNFVQETLLPFVTKQAEEYLKKNWDNETVKEAVKGLKEGAELDQAAALAQIKELTDKKSDNKSLKTIQGLIYKQGYETGDLKAHIFDDVKPAIESWSKSRKIAIFSTGSVEAQKLLCAHTVHGDVTAMISEFFDQEIGEKTEKATYEAIAKKLDVPVAEIVFITDCCNEAKASKEAGLTTFIIKREGNAELSEDQTKDFTLITSFKDISFEGSSKRKIEEETSVVEEPPTKIAKTEEETKKTDEEKAVENGGDKVEEKKEEEKKKEEPVVEKAEEAMEVDGAAAVEVAKEVTEKETTETKEADKPAEEPKTETKTEEKVKETPATTEPEATAAPAAAEGNKTEMETDSAKPEVKESTPAKPEKTEPAATKPEANEPTKTEEKPEEPTVEEKKETKSEATNGTTPSTEEKENKSELANGMSNGKKDSAEETTNGDSKQNGDSKPEADQKKPEEEPKEKEESSTSEEIKAKKLEEAGDATATPVSVEA